MTLVWTPGFNYDTNASAYIDAVEAADGQALETATRYAINDFVIGCKNDGIWSAIKASCILAGARTLTGALVPLTGTAPTNFNFVSGDYNRETGLVGNGSTKYLDSNRNNNTDPQDNQHISVFVSTVTTSDASSYPIYIGADELATSGATHIGRFNNNGQLYSRNRSGAVSFVLYGTGSEIGLLGLSRNSSGSYIARASQANQTIVTTSISPFNGNINVYGGTVNYISNARLAFYSIGESLDLALLDTRVTALINAFAAAIP